MAVQYGAEGGRVKALLREEFPVPGNRAWSFADCRVPEMVCTANV